MKKLLSVSAALLLSTAVPALAMVFLSPTGQTCYTEDELSHYTHYEATGNVNSISIDGYICANSWNFFGAPALVHGAVIIAGQHFYDFKAYAYDYKPGSYGDETLCYTQAQLEEQGDFTTSDDVNAETLNNYQCARQWQFAASTPPSSVIVVSLSQSKLP